MTLKQKPQLAEDAILNKMTFPKWAQPKIDGVRAMNITGQLTGRSLDPFKGFGITEYFSKPHFVGFDGEMTLGDVPNSMDRLCAATSGAMGRFKGVEEMANLHWWVFDYITPATTCLPYVARYDILSQLLRKLGHDRVHLVPYTVVKNREEADATIGRHLDLNYEGTIWRSPVALMKPGRSSAHKEQELLRSKPWADSEILVTHLSQGNSNQNEAKKNTLGRTERSSAGAGMVPNGMVGTIHGTLTEDFFHPITKKLMFPKGLPCDIAPGKMTDVEAKHYWENQNEIIGKVIKFQHMTHGVKDQPRFGGFLSFRLKEDMS